MTLKLQHPFTLIVAGPSCCGKSTFVIRLLELKISSGVTVKTTPRITWKTFHSLKAYQISKIPKTYLHLVLDGLIDSAYSTKVSELFTKGSHHRNISLVVITQILFYQGQSSRTISLSSKYITVFKNTRDKTQIVYLARQDYPENISSFHKTYLEACKDPHSYLFLDLTQRSTKI